MNVVLATKVGILKPFRIEDRKDANNRVSETTANKWKGSVLQNIRKEPRWVPLLDLVWRPKKVPNRGLEPRPAQEGPPAVPEVPAAAIAADVDSMLEYISQYAPNSLYRDITVRSTSLNNVWDTVRKWAGLKTAGCLHQSYWQVKRSFDPNGDITPTDFYFLLRNAKEDCLLLTRDHGGRVRFNGEFPEEDEELTATLESDVVADWLEALGGPSLQDHVVRVYSTDLEACTLADIRQKISDNLESLMLEAAQQTETNAAKVQ